MKFSKTLLTVILSAVFISSYSQYTYIEGGVGYSNVSFRASGYSGGNTANHTMNLRIGVTHRIIRNFGIGLQASFPVVQGGPFGFPMSGLSSFVGFKSTDKRFHPSKFDYSFKESIRGTFILRVFFDTRVNSYFDARFSVLSMTENFVLRRPYQQGVSGAYYSVDNFPTLPELNINYSKKHLLFVPGFLVGIKPHLTKHLFLNFNLGTDIFIFEDKIGFNYTVPYDKGISNTTKDVQLKSQAVGTKVSFALNFGLGYYF